MAAPLAAPRVLVLTLPVPGEPLDDGGVARGLLKPHDLRCRQRPRLRDSLLGG
ncbi:hypothetical protein [Streptomyces sp. NPDC045470]|uniref:hypothetical protein n=1 Tax=Streptomyces sp. NPDC045470 TaxID=3155469 RepID=UPI00340A12FB